MNHGTTGSTNIISLLSIHHAQAADPQSMTVTIITFMAQALSILAQWTDTL
jgi:hypothetical protein